MKKNGACVLIKCGNDILAISRPNKNYLGFPGGKVEEGEDFFDAAKRELFEETGVICPNNLPVLYEGICTSSVYPEYSFYVKTFFWEISLEEKEKIIFNTEEDTNPQFLSHDLFLTKTEFVEYNNNIYKALSQKCQHYPKKLKPSV